MTRAYNERQFAKMILPIPVSPSLLVGKSEKAYTPGAINMLT